MIWRQMIVFGISLLTVSSLTGQDDIDAKVEEYLDELVETYQYFHAHPELSYQEKETSGYLAKRLRSLGYEVTERVGRYNDPQKTSYGFVAVMRNGDGPTVMVRTDLDALPVKERTGLPYASDVLASDESGEQVSVMHACGHDVHMTTLLGVATVLKEIHNRWQGTLLLIGQPAEERGAGARAMLNDGLYTRFPRPDFALALHVNASLAAGELGYCPGYALASVDSVDITVRGRGGHGAYPQRTQDPIVLAAQIVMALQTIVSREVSPLEPAVVTVGSIHGGTKHNIIPDEVHLQLTVRSYKPDVRRQILNSIERISKGVASASGINPENAPIIKVDENEHTPATYNDPELTEKLVPVMIRALGEENVLRMDPVMGGEDFSRYSLEDHQIPICLLWLGAVDPRWIQQHEKTARALPSLHSSRFAPLPKPTIQTGVKAITSAVVHLMQRRP